MKKLIIASFVSLAMTGNAFACGEIPGAQASKEPEVKVASKAEDAHARDVEVLEKAEAEASNTPEAKSE